LTFARHDLSSSPYGQVTQGINVGDIDGDGRPDLVVGGDQYLLWYHNPDWTPNLIANGFKFAGGAMIVVRDMDGDGRLDVLTGRYIISDPNNRQMVWYGNTPAGWAPHVVSPRATATTWRSPTSTATGARTRRATTTGRSSSPGCRRRRIRRRSGRRTRSTPAASWAPMSRTSTATEGSTSSRGGRGTGTTARGNFVRYPYTAMVDAADRFFDDYSKVNVLDLNGDGRSTSS
jgi:hypothetical protein